MFERSLVISQRSQASAGQRWTALASLSLQVSVAALLVVVPLLHPEAMYLGSSAPRALVPLPRMPKMKPVVVQQSAAASSAASSLLTVFRNPFTAPRQIPSGIAKGEDAPVARFTGMGDPNGVPMLMATGDVPVRPVTVIAARPAGTLLKISSGVSAGMLVSPIHAVYPTIAVAARVQGTVVVEAVISKAGAIESLHVVSGPEMLRGAALDAVRTARYQPYRLNGEPTEVQTTFTVNFKLGA